MGRKKLIVCNIRFDDNQTIEQKILSMFAPENIINCFSETHFDSYREVIEHENIQIILREEELMTTIQAFFENNLNLSQTSAAGYMHRNTLIYRLDKIFKLTGLNLKKFEHAVVFKNLLVINDIIQNYHTAE